MDDPSVVPCFEPSDDCEGPGYTPCARFKQDAKRYHTNQMDMDEFICMVIRRDEEIRILTARVSELEGERANYWPVEKAVAPWMLENANLLERVEKTEDGIDAAIRMLAGAQGEGYQVKTLLETIRYGEC